MTLHSLSGAWPISKPVQRLAGIRRLERNARRWRLRISRWIYEVTGPRYALKLLRYPRRNQVAPDSLRRKAAASLYSWELKQATPCSNVGNSITTKRLNFSGPSRV